MRLRREQLAQPDHALDGGGGAERAREQREQRAVGLRELRDDAAELGRRRRGGGALGLQVGPIDGVRQVVDVG